MIRSSDGWWIVALLAVASGCGDDDGVGPRADAGVVDAQVDGHPDAHIEGDAALAPCDPACGEGEACLRGVCVATCGAAEGELAAWDAALAAELVPVANVCHVPGGPLTVVGTRVYEVSASISGSTTTFTLSRWTLDPVVSTPELETLATTTHEGHAMGEIFPGGYVAISPDEMRAIYGYTTTDAGSIGGVFDVALGGGTATLTGANGNFDGAWLDANTYVVNGLGIEGEASEGQGLYTRDVSAPSVRRAVDAMGTYSGSVAISGDLVIAAGLEGFGSTWPDESEGGRLFVFSRDEILTGRATISAWDDAAARLEGPSIFTIVGARRLVSAVWGDAGIAALEARALEESGGAWTLGEPEPLTTGGGFTAAVAAGEDRVLLVHGDGVLLVE